MKTVAEAIAAAQAESRLKTPFATGACLKHVRTWWGIDSKHPDATSQWTESKHQHPGNAKDAPAGAPVLWTGGSEGHGHIAIAVGDGEHVWSTDIIRPGHTDIATIAEVHEKWGLDLKGWTGDINDVVLPLDPAKPPAPKPVTVSLANIQAAAAHDPKAAQGSTVHKADVLVVENALVAAGFLGHALVDGSYGTATVAAYAAFQRSLGYSGKDANGIPGHASLLELGRKHGFSIN